MKSKNIAIAFALSVTSFLSACGGGGGDAAATPAPASSAQGVYEGTTSSGFAIRTLVLDNDQYWTLYGENTGSVFELYGMVQGNGQSNNGSFTSTNLKDFFFDGSVDSGTLSASYVPGVSFNGTSSNGVQSISFTSTALKSAQYDYNTAPVLSNITGNWLMTELSGNGATLNIATNGNFTGSSAGCAYNGTLRPRASGKNVYDVVVTFGAAPCRLPNQSASGVAVDYLLANGRRELLVAGVNAARTQGTVIFGAR